MPRASCPICADLGVSHLYASPILTARAGSMHGYDVVDPTRVNPELGGEAGLRDLVAALRAAGLGLIVDIVPEPHGGRRQRQRMVAGRAAPWSGQPLRRATSTSTGTRPIPRCAASCWRRSWPALRRGASGRRDPELAQDADGAPVIRYFDDTLSGCPVATTPRSPPLGPAAYDPATEDGRARLHRLLERQHYRLAWWGTAGRRDQLAPLLRHQRPRRPAHRTIEEVFEATHATLFRLYAEGLIDGMRIDHVDGLTDPPGYCRRLRARLEALTAERPASAPPRRPYIVVEKILGAGETMPTDWGVDGTSGYDFMDQVSAVQHDPEAERSLAFFWSAVSGRPADFATEEALARRQILERGFDAQLEATATHAAPSRPAGPAHPRHHPAGDPPRLARAAGAFPGVSHLQCRRPTLARRTRPPSPSA